MRVELDPDSLWVAQLSGSSSEQVDPALDAAAKERRLFGHLDREHRSEGRPHYVEIDAPLELYALVRLLRPLHVVEVGVSSGVSSAYLLQGLERNARGTLHSVDLPKVDRRVARGRPQGSWSLPKGRTSGWAVPFALRKRWDLRLGDKAEVIPLLAEELDRIDLFVYDVPHNDRTSVLEFDAVDRRMRRGGVAIADHGPGGGLCAALRRWSRRRGATPTGRRGTGLYGFRAAAPRRAENAAR